MGSSPSNNASKQAEAQERARQAAIKQSISGIDATFNSPERQKQYTDFLAAVRQFYQDHLGRAQVENSRNLKFSLARSGNTGGSVAVDQGRDLLDAFNRGTVEADRMAQSDLAGLKGADATARLNLIGMAQAGLDATTATSNAALSLKNNLEAGKSQRNAGALDDVFGKFSDLYRRSKEAAATSKGNKYVYNTLYQPSLFSGYNSGGR